MHGESILVRGLTTLRIPDRYGNLWQYHSRSDRHAKIACWAIVFDLLERCSLMCEHAREGKIAFELNYGMTQLATGRKKNLDVVLAVPRSGAFIKRSILTFSGLVAAFGIQLTPEENEVLGRLPIVLNRRPGEIVVALESKACMTAHVKAGPRFYDELASSAAYMNSSARDAVAIGYAMINAASTFISSDRNKFALREHAPIVSIHDQPDNTASIQSVVGRLPVRAHVNGSGFDAIGVSTLVVHNNGSPVELASVPLALSPQHQLHYNTMIDRVAATYESRFATL